ncbi:MAG: NAD-dependent epimerase/dehydratase family protein, partial [Flavobacterium sp.]
MDKNAAIYIAGHQGMVGSAIWRTLKAKGYHNLIGASSKELDLREQEDVRDFLRKTRPDVIIDAAAKVGGIMANNDFPYQFLMENMQIQNNLIGEAHKLGV